MIKTRSTLPRFLAAASVLLCVVSSARAQDKVLLRMNLQSGQTFDQDYTMEMETSQTIQQERMDMITTTRFDLHNDVLDVDKDGNIKLKTTYQAIVFSLRGSIEGQAFPSEHYDSKRPPKNIPAGLEPLAKLVGFSLITTISPQGRPIEIEGIEAVLQRMLSGIKDKQERALMEKSIKQNLDSASKFSTGITHFSETPVAVGDSWSSTVFSAVPMQLSAKYTLISSNNDIATLALSSQFSPNPKAPALDTSMFKIKSNISGTQSGVVRVDEKTGLTISSELHLDMKNVTLITAVKSSSNDKSTPSPPSSITSHTKGTMRSWTVKLPQ